MTRETAEACVRALEASGARTVDLTGGAPELNRHFRFLVDAARGLGLQVIDRCNLTVLVIESQRGLAEYLAEREVEILASLPYFLASRTDAQRGDGVFEQSIEALRRLNRLGYGAGGGLVLNLVYNPTGAFLPGDQRALENEFRREMDRRYGIRFDHLFAITNMPISRFLDYLIETGNYHGYMTRLVNAFNPAAAATVMCRNTISVGWDGRLYDCDFNQMLDDETGYGAPAHIADFDAEALAAPPHRHRPCIATAAPPAPDRAAPAQRFEPVRPRRGAAGARQGAVEVREFPRPDPAPGEILLETIVSEVCGTDVHIRDGRFAGAPYPIILGHVAVGRVVEANRVRHDALGGRLRPGDVVSFYDVFDACGDCYSCLVSRQPNRCPERRVYGISCSADEGLLGGWAENILLRPGVRAAVLPPELSADDVIGGGCGLFTGFAAVERADIRLGESVVVQGVGPVGLAAAAFARASGAGEILAIGEPAARRRLAGRLGADRALGLAATTAEERAASVREATGGRGADVVIEASGNPRAVPEGLAMVRDGGRYVIVGHYTDAGPTSVNPHLDIKPQARRNSGTVGERVPPLATSARGVFALSGAHDVFRHHRRALSARRGESRARRRRGAARDQGGHRAGVGRLSVGRIGHPTGRVDEGTRTPNFRNHNPVLCH